MWLVNRLPGLVEIVLRLSNTRQRNFRIAKRIYENLENSQGGCFIGQPSSKMAGNELLVFIGPYPPAKTGIAKFSEELLRAAATVARVRVVPTGLSKQEDVSYESFVRPLNHVCTACQHLTKRYVVHLGNGPQGQEPYEFQRLMKSLVIVHDARLPDVWNTGGEGIEFDQNDYKTKVKTFGARLALTENTIAVLGPHGKKELQDQAKSIGLEFNNIAVLDSGHPVPFTPDNSLKMSNRRVIGTFGFQSEQKSPLETYSLMAMIAKATGFKAVIVGDTPPALISLAKRIWRTEGNREADLKILGHVDRAVYLKTMESCAIAIQLKAWSNGETSGVLPELMGLGVPFISTDFDANGVTEYSWKDGKIKVPPFKAHGPIGTFLLGELTRASSDLLADEGSQDMVSSEILALARQKPTFTDLALEILELSRK